MFYSLHKQRNLTTILVTHSMEDAAAYADELIVMHKGTVKAKGTPRELFSRKDDIAALGLDLPETIKFQKRLEETLGITFKAPILTIEEAASEVKALFQEENAL